MCSSTEPTSEIARSAPELRHADEIERFRMDVDPRELFDDSDAEFTIGVLAPGCR